jgi:hypothetical protein
MRQRPRIYYTQEQKNLMWDRWQASDSTYEIAKLFDRGHPSIQGVLEIPAKIAANSNPTIRDRRVIRNANKFMRWYSSLEGVLLTAVTNSGEWKCLNSIVLLLVSIPNTAEWPDDLALKPAEKRDRTATSPVAKVS